MLIDRDPIVLLGAKVVAIVDSPKSSEDCHKSAHNYRTTTQKAHTSLAHIIVVASHRVAITIINHQSRKPSQTSSNVKAESLL
jgi:hypothetical protein